MRANVDIENAIDTCGDAVLRAASVYLPHADAEDAFQETFLRYARSDTTFNDDEHRRAWLIRVAINIAKDMLKASSSRVEDLEEAPEPFCDDESATLDDRERIIAALRELPPDQRRALLLCVGAGYSTPQVAQALGRPVNTIYSLVHRGKARLREVLGDA